MQALLKSIAKIVANSFRVLLAKTFAAFQTGLRSWPLRPQRPLRPSPPATVAAVKSPSLVKSRPASLEQRYRILHDGELADEVFYRLRRRLYSEIDKTATPRGQAIFREAGRIAPDRPYFYLKPAGQAGWLFERSGAGWIVSRAEKIVEKNLFLREDTALDQVNLYFATDRPAFPRVKSLRHGGDLLSFAVYEQKLLQSLSVERRL